MLINREVIAVKTEVTYRTDPAPVPADDAVLVENPSWAHEGARMIDRPAIRHSIGKLQQVYGGTLKTVSFDCELKGSGAAGTAPEIDALLDACGLAGVVVPATSVTYRPVSTGHPSVTIYYWQDGTLHRLVGCRGNVSFNGEVGGRGMLSFVMTGHPLTVIDTTLPSSAVYDATIAPPFIDGGFSMDSFAAIINAMAVDLSNTVATPPDLNQTNGYGEVLITGRDVNGSFDPQHELVATEDFLGNWQAGAAALMDTGTIGGTAGNRWQLSMSNVYYREIAPGDRDGVRTLDIGFGAAENSGDDEIALLFT